MVVLHRPAPGHRGRVEREFHHVRRAGPGREFVPLEHPAVPLDRAPGDRQVDRVDRTGGPADLDPGDLAALGGGQHHHRCLGRAVRVGRFQRERHAADVRDQVGQGPGEALAVGDHLHARGVHRVPDPAGADQFARLLDGALDDLVQPDHSAVQLLLAVLGLALEPLVGEHPVDQGAEPAALVGQPPQGPVGLRPELSGRVGGQRVDPPVQRVQRPAQFALQNGRQMLVPRDQRQLPGPVGERHHRADQLVAVPDRGGGQVDRHRPPVLAPEHRAPDPVLAPRGQGVQQRRALQGQRAAVRLGVLDQRVQLAAAQLAGPVVEDVRGGRVDQHHAAFEVHPEHAFGGGPQDHLGLLVLPAQLGLDAEPAAQVADQQEQQLTGGAAVLGVERGVAGAAALLAVVREVVAGDLDREGRAVRAPGGHPDRPVQPLGLARGGPHRAGDPARVELGQQVQHAHPDQRGARGLHRLDGGGVGVHDGAVAVHQQQCVGQCVEYGGEASSASDRPAAHVDRSPHGLRHGVRPAARALLGRLEYLILLCAVDDPAGNVVGGWCQALGLWHHLSRTECTAGRCGPSWRRLRLVRSMAPHC
ncbi:hypothetical protein GCM10009664_61010 [Kitasatospora gansuensis]